MALTDRSDGQLSLPDHSDLLVIVKPLCLVSIGCKQFYRYLYLLQLYSFIS